MDECQAHLVAAKITLTDLIEESKEKHARWRRLSEILHVNLERAGSVSNEDQPDDQVGQESAPFAGTRSIFCFCLAA